MCLSVAISRPDCVLAKGEHLGFEWQVVHNDGGYRCGYVRVPKGHPRHGVETMEQPVDVHGGCTFSQPDTDCGKGDDDAWWVGFDCAHAWDARDPDLPNNRGWTSTDFVDGVVRSQSYVESECRRLCEQANDAASGKWVCPDCDGTTESAFERCDDCIVQPSST